MRDAIGARLPELPAARAERFERELGLDAARAHEIAFRRELADYYERALASADGGRGQAVAVSNWIPQLVDLLRRADSQVPDPDPADSRVDPEALATLAAMVAAKEISRDAGRDVLTRLVSEGGDPRVIVAREGLQAISGDDGDQLRELVDAAIAADPDAAEKVRSGNMKAIGPLVGYVMRETKGRADGGEVTRMIRERVNAGS